MAEVPTQDLPTVAPQVIRPAGFDANVSPDAFGAGTGRAVAGLFQVAGDYAIKQQHQANQLAVTAAGNELDAGTEADLYDPKTGILNQHPADPADAAKLVDKSISNWDARASKIRAGLSDERQRTAFDQNAAQARLGVLHKTNLFQHVTGEEYQKNQFELGVANARRQAVNDAGLPAAPPAADPVDVPMDQPQPRNGQVGIDDRALQDEALRQSEPTPAPPVQQAKGKWASVDAAIEKQLKLIDDYAATQNWSPQMRDAAHLQAVSSTHAEIVDKFLREDKEATASAYFADHKDEIYPDVRAKLTQQLEITSLRGESQQAVDKLLREPGMTLDGAITEIGKIEDPKLREQTEERAVRMFSLRATDIAEKQRAVMASAWQTMNTDPQGIDAITAAERIAMGPERWSTLEAAAKRQAAQIPMPWQDSKAQRYKIEDLLTNPATRERTLAAGPAAFIATMNEDDMNAVATQMRDLAANGSNESSWLTTREGIVNEALAGMKINPAPYITKDGVTTPNEPAVGFRRAVEQESIVLASAAKRTKPNIDDVQKAADAVMKRMVSLNKWGTDPEVVAATVAADQRGNAYVPIDKMNPGKAQAIRELIEQAGGNATDDRIQRAYAARQMNDRALFDQIISEP